MGKRFYTEEFKKTIIQVTDYQNNVRRVVLFQPETYEVIFDEKVQCDKDQWNGFLAHYDLLMEIKEDFSYKEVAYTTGLYFNEYGLFADYETKYRTIDLCSCKDVKPPTGLSLHDPSITLPNNIEINHLFSGNTLLFVKLIEKHCSKSWRDVIIHPLKEEDFPLDETGKEWVRVDQAKDRLNLAEKTLETYRGQGIKFEDKKSGIDIQGNRWRQTDRASEYLLPSAPPIGSDTQ